MRVFIIFLTIHVPIKIDISEFQLEKSRFIVKYKEIFWIFHITEHFSQKQNPSSVNNHPIKFRRENWKPIPAIIFDPDTGGLTVSGW